MTLTAAPLTGCVTVHGERALIPSVTKAEAAKALDRFTEVNNEANKNLDAKLIATVESGPLGAVDGAGLRARNTVAPGGNPDFKALGLGDPRFLIPRQVGWPKWFVADVAPELGESGSGTNRWLMVFERGGAREAWRVSYVASVRASAVPEFTRDTQGYVQPVAAEGSGLVVDPGELGGAYTGYLAEGDAKDASVFAPGSSTSELVSSRAKTARTAQSATQYADQPATEGDFAPLGLRTKDGGALVFFATHHTAKITMLRPGVTPQVDTYTRALMTGTPKKSVTLGRIARQTVLVPAKKDGGGQVVFLTRTVGLVAARGE
ncbi:hypothetical protein [Actinacidiphila glaucinigra]|uniref:hypothetical protein n=1 Tax=Actinacidiphila glaucinigra TaxID=235986 RepID=UPI00366DFF2F